MEICIKPIANGWLVSYPVYGHPQFKSDHPAGAGYYVDEVSREERAFTYHFDEQKGSVWNSLTGFLAVRLGVQRVAPSASSEPVAE